MGCVWFIHRKMELRYWLVPGNVKNNRINWLNEKRSQGISLSQSNCCDALNLYKLQTLRMPENVAAFVMLVCIILCLCSPV